MGGVRFVLVASIATTVVVGKGVAFAESASERIETLPPVEVTAPGEGVKRGRSREATRIVRPRPKVYIPTTLASVTARRRLTA
jgi:hypothetical protein